MRKDEFKTNLMKDTYGNYYIQIPDHFLKVAGLSFDTQIALTVDPITWDQSDNPIEFGVMITKLDNSKEEKNGSY